MSILGARSHLQRQFSATLFDPVSPRATNELENFPPDFIDFIKSLLIEPEPGVFNFNYEAKKTSRTKDNYENTFRYRPEKPNTRFEENIYVQVVVPPFENKKNRRAYLIFDQLGEGGEGRVLKALDMLSKEPTVYVCKITKHGRSESTSDNELASPFVIKERKNLETFGRLVDIFSHCYNDIVFCYTFMTYYPGKSLIDHLYETDGRGIDKTYLEKKEHDFLHLLNICIAIIEEVIGIHQKGFVWRDLRTDQFVISDQSATFLKLIGIDLGSLETFDAARNIKHLDGTTNGYRAPELESDHFRKTNGYGVLQDYFSLGVVLAEILTETNYQVNIVEALKRQTVWRTFTAEEIQSMMSDVFAEKDLSTYRKKTLDHTPNDDDDNDDDDEPALTKERSNTLVPSDKTKEHARRLLVELCYKLMLSLNTNQDFKRPNETELNNHLETLKAIRFQLATEQTKTELVNGDSLRRLERYRRRQRGTSSTLTSPREDTSKESASSLSESTVASDCDDEDDNSKEKEPVPSTRSYLELLASLDDLIKEMSLDEKLTARQSLRSQIIINQFNSARGATSTEEILERIEGVEDLIQELPHRDKLLSGVKKIRQGK